MNKEKIEAQAASVCAAATAGALTVFDKTANAVGKAMTKRWGKILVTLPLALSLTAITAFAETDAEGVVEQIVTIIKTWVPRVGALVIVFGAVNTGLGVANSDDAGRNRGLMTMAGGAIVTAIASIIEI